MSPRGEHLIRLARVVVMGVVFLVLAAAGLHTGQLFHVSGDVLDPDLSPLPNALAIVLGPIDSLGQFVGLDSVITDLEGHFDRYYLPGTYSFLAWKEGYLLSNGKLVDLPPDTVLTFILDSPGLTINRDSVLIVLDEELAGSDTLLVTNTGSGILFFSLQESNYPQHPAKSNSAVSLEKRYGGSVTADQPVDSLWQLIYPDTDQKTDMDIKSISSQFDADGNMLYFRMTGWRPWVEIPGTWWGLFVIDADADPTTGDPIFGGEYMLVRESIVGEFILYWIEEIQDYEVLGSLPYADVGDSTFELGVNLDLLEMNGSDPELMNIIGSFITPIDPDTFSIIDAVPANGGSSSASVSIHDDPAMEIEPRWGFLGPGESAEIIVSVDMGPGKADTLRSAIVLIHNEPLSNPFKIPVMLYTPSGVGEEEESSVPMVYSLSQNYPNPFNPVTRMHYDIPNSVMGKVKVLFRLYDMRGRLVRTLVDEKKEPGSYSVEWDGRDERGELVSSGVYLYRMESGDFYSLKKMVLLK